MSFVCCVLEFKISNECLCNKTIDLIPCLLTSLLDLNIPIYKNHVVYKQKVHTFNISNKSFQINV